MKVMKETSISSEKVLSSPLSYIHIGKIRHPFWLKSEIGKGFKQRIFENIFGNIIFFSVILYRQTYSLLTSIAL